jgi:hypothetical protein
MQDPETFNGSTALIVYQLSEIRSDVRTIKDDVRDHRYETRTGMQVLTQRLDYIEAKAASPLDRLKDLSGYLMALAVVILAAAGKYDLIGMLLSASGR